jgi:hypothetical protein
MNRVSFVQFNFLDLLEGRGSSQSIDNEKQQRHKSLTSLILGVVFGWATRMHALGNDNESVGTEETSSIDDDHDRSASSEATLVVEEDVTIVQLTSSNIVDPRSIAV